MEFDIKNFNQQVITNMEGKLAYYQTLARYTKQSVKLKKHLANIRFYEEIIDDYKEECGIQ